MLVDSHCHLDLLELQSHALTLEDVIAAARTAQIEHLLSVSVQLERLPYLLQQARQFACVSVSCGVHPNEVPGQIPTVEQLLSLADDPLIVAIGETGLDTYRSSGDLSWQKTRFANHITAAKQLQLPIIVHARDAKEETLAVIKQQQAAEVGGVLHCFTEDWDMANRAIDENFYISFSGIVTFKNAKTLQEVAKRCPLERMLVETDSPFLAPTPLRGKANFPAYVKHVAQFIADLREMSLADLAAATTANYYRLFAKSRRHAS